MKKETDGSEEEQEAGDEEVTTTNAERKWVHGDDGEDGFGNEDLVWIRLRAFIYKSQKFQSSLLNF